MAASKKSTFRYQNRSNKEWILQMVERWDDDISFDQALYHLEVMKAVMEGLEQMEQGLGIDHDELFDELEQLCDAEENQNSVDAASRKKPERNSPTDRRRRLPKNGQVLRKSPKKVHRPAS